MFSSTGEVGEVWGFCGTTLGAALGESQLSPVEPRAQQKSFSGEDEGRLVPPGPLPSSPGEAQAKVQDLISTCLTSFRPRLCSLQQMIYGA